MALNSYMIPPWGRAILCFFQYSFGTLNQEQICFITTPPAVALWDSAAILYPTATFLLRIGFKAQLPTGGVVGVLVQGARSCQQLPTSAASMRRPRAYMHARMAQSCKV